MPDVDGRMVVQVSAPFALAQRLRKAVPAGERSPLICALLADHLDRLEAADAAHEATVAAVAATTPTRRAR